MAAARKKPQSKSAAPAGGAAKAQRIAAIDLGATSVRLKVVELASGRAPAAVEQLVHPIALGADTFRLNYIAPATVRSLGQVLANFARVLQENDVVAYRAVATSAIRDATNRDVVLDRLRHACGMAVKVLDPVEESRLTYQILEPFLRRHLAKRAGQTLLLDIGGGSTELMALRRAKIVMVGSRRLGTSRLYHNIRAADCADARALLQSLIGNTVHSTRDLFGATEFRALLVVNSVLRELAGRRPGARALEQGCVIPAAEASALVRESCELSPAALTERYGLAQAEAELALPALLVLESFLALTGAEEVFFPEVDLLAGVLGDIAMTLGGANPQAAFREQILGSLEGLLEKYRVDRAHAEQVRRLSLELFDAFERLLDLGSNDRLLLEVAAMLHDIGRFMNDRDHHKHGMYIVSWSEIAGLTEEDRKTVSLLVRYHRKGRPSATHLEYASLPAPERLRVAKLASLLRIADALDLSHDQRVERLSVRIGEDAVEIGAASGGGLSVEETSLVSKGRLFTDLTGLTLRLQRRLG